MHQLEGGSNGLKEQYCMHELVAYNVPTSVLPFNPYVSGGVIL